MIPITELNKTEYLVLFAANLVFIVTHLYGWLLKWFYKPQAYGENFVQLFPAYKAVGWLYLLQMLELPYLLHIGQDDTLLYANSFAMLVYPLLLLAMCEGYFFPDVHRRWRDYMLFMPSIVVLIPLLLQAIGLIILPEWHRTATFIVVGILFIWQFGLTISMALRIGRAIRRVNEDTYADIDDFPTRTGEKMQWLPTCVCLLMAINFVIDDPAVKACRDVFFTVCNVWFCIYTLNPRRKAFEKEEKPLPQPVPAKDAQGNGGTPSRLSDERYRELSQQLESLLTDERIFTEQHITADILMRRLGINANYLTELIQRSGYASFYDMICQHRVRHAIALIHQHPDRLLADIADLCGFSSPSSMAKAFASQGKRSPSTYRHG